MNWVIPLSGLLPTPYGWALTSPHIDRPPLSLGSIIVVIPCRRRPHGLSLRR